MLYGTRKLMYVIHTGVLPKNVIGSALGPRAKEKAHKA